MKDDGEVEKLIKLAAYMTLGKPCFPGANRYKISPRENNSENNPLNVWGELSLQFWFSE